MSETAKPTEKKKRLQLQQIKAQEIREGDVITCGSTWAKVAHVASDVSQSLVQLTLAAVLADTKIEATTLEYKATDMVPVVREV